MAKIVTGAIRRIYKNLIKDVVKDLGESVLVYGAPDSEDCPNCLRDLVTGTSKGVFDSTFVVSVVIFDVTITPQAFTRGRCPVCKGDGFLFSRTATIVRALVKWNPQDGELENTPAGVEGQNIVRIKARSSNYAVIRDNEYVTIDGVKCELVKPPVYRGLGAQDELVVAFFKAVQVGKNVKT